MSRDTVHRGQEVARREVRRAVEASGPLGSFAEKAGVDPGTLGDFLSGKRWAHSVTRKKIEMALGWPVGRIADLAEGHAVDHVEITAGEGEEQIWISVPADGLTEEQKRTFEAVVTTVAKEIRRTYDV